MSNTTPPEYVRAHREDLIALALDLLATDTTNPPGDTREIVTEIERFLEPVSVDVERVVADPAKPNLLVRVPGQADQTLLFDGHLDTVPFGVDAWTRDPLRRTRPRLRRRPWSDRHERGRGVDAVRDSGLRSHRSRSPVRFRQRRGSGW